MRRGQSHRVHTLLAVIAMLVCIACMRRECLVCATMSFWPLTPPGANSGRARTHALHVRIIPYTFYPRAWSLRAAGLALDRPFWLDVW